MKKFFFILLILLPGIISLAFATDLAISPSTSAPDPSRTDYTAPYTQNFNGSWPPADWGTPTTVFEWGTGFFVEINFFQSHSQACAPLYWGTAGSPLNLWSPLINVPGPMYRLKFKWSHGQLATYNLDHGAVYVNETKVWQREGTEFNSNDGYTINPDNGVGIPGSGVMESIDLSPWAGHPIYVRFEGTASFGPEWYIDDFAVEYVDSSISTFPNTQTFSTTTFPPQYWSTPNSWEPERWWIRSTANAYGATGTGSALCSFESYAAGKNVDLRTQQLNLGPYGGKMSYDYAYSPYLAANADESLSIEYSFNWGATFAYPMATYYAAPSSSLITAAPHNSYGWTPSATDWATNTLALPIGVNAVRFRGTSAQNGRLFIDNVKFEKNYFVSGDGTEGNPYIVSTAAELNLMRNYLGSASARVYFKLGNNIDLTAYLAPGGEGYIAWGTNGWLPIGNGTTPFYGGLDGNGHSISGLRMAYYGTYHGLIGYAATGSVIKNLSMGSDCNILGDAHTSSIVGFNAGTIDNCSSAATVKLGNAQNGGGIVGTNDTGSISNCTFTGSVTRSADGVNANALGGIVGNNGTTGTVTRCKSNATINGSLWTGGIAGWNYGTISLCKSTGNISAYSNSNGGVVGQNNGNITNSYSRCNITGAQNIGGLVGNHGSGTISNCYSTGTVSGSPRGGLIGARSGTVNGSYWDTQTSGIGTSSGGTGKTTVEMRSQTTFTGWDFVAETANGTADYWGITSTDNNGYPFLAWEVANEQRSPILISPADLATGMPETGFELAWTANPVGILPSTYNIYMMRYTSPGVMEEHLLPVVSGTTFNPVTQGGITFNYGQTWYWSVIGYTATGAEFPNSTTRSFTIEKDPFVTESFETGNTNGSAVISDWPQALGSGSNYWTVNNIDNGYNTTPRTDSFNVILNYSGGTNTWMFRSVPLTGGVSYDVELYARQFTSAPANANIGIYYGTAGTIAGMTNTVVAQSSLTSGSYQRISSSFTPATTDTYYLGIRTVIAGTTPNYVSLDDITISLTPPILSYTPHTIDFDVTALNLPTAYQNVTITNTGGLTLNLEASNIILTGTDSTQFSFTTTGFPAALTVGQSVAIPVRFNPTSQGVKTATLSITHNTDIYDVSLTGTSQAANALLESFEGSFAPQGWTRDNNWNQTSYQVYHGVKSAYRPTDSSTSITLSTPVLTLTGASILNFKTYVPVSTYQNIQPAYYNPSTSAWINIGSAISLSPDTWQSHSVALTGITGNYKLGFAAYYSAGGSSSQVYLDLVYGPEITPPGAPTLALPITDATDVNLLPAFTWEAPASGGFVTGYRVFCDQNANPTTQITSSLLTGLTFTATAALNYSADYYWKVVAYGTGIDSTSSTIRKFTTNPDPQIVAFPYLQDFSSLTFPPYGWSKNSGFSWNRNEYFGIGGWGDGCAQADFFYQTGVIDLDTPFINLGGNRGILAFAHAYAPNSNRPTNIDQLEILYSTDGGSNYTSLILYSGGESGLLTTASATSNCFAPDVTDWAFKSVALPMGTNKVRFRGIGANGNALYLDNINISKAPFAGGIGTEADPFRITDAAEFDYVHSYVGDTHADKYFKLMNDIDLAAYLAPGGAGYAAWGTNGWLPIGNPTTPFYGNFDGNNFTVSNLRTQYYGFYHGTFGTLGTGGVIRNLVLAANCYVLGDRETGSIAGRNSGTVQNCRSAATVNIGNNQAGGGLVGYNTGTIIGSSFSGTITRSGTGVTSTKIGGICGNSETGSFITDCSSTGSISGNNWCGGLVGWNQGTINRCYTSGSINSAGNSVGGLVGEHRGTINNSYSRATVSGASYVGGLVGYNNSSTITNSYSTGTVAGSQRGGLCGQSGAVVTNSYWDTQTSGIATSYGGIGKTTVQMHTQSSFDSWDFVSTWFTNSAYNDGYPQLMWTTSEIPVAATPINLGIQPGTVSGTIILTWDNMNANWYGVYSGSTPSNLTYLGWVGTNCITVQADNLGFFQITSGSGTPTSPEIIQEQRIKN